MSARRRRRRFGDGIRYRHNEGSSMFSESKTDRQFTGNDIVDSAYVSDMALKFDIFNQSNVVIAEYNSYGSRMYFEPCPNRMIFKVNRKLYKTRKRQKRAEGW